MSRYAFAFAISFIVGSFVSLGCSVFRSAQKDPAAAVATVRADAERACAELPKLEAAGLVTGKAAKDADAFCAAVGALAAP